MEATAAGSTDTLEVFHSETLIKGRPTLAEYIRVGGQTYSIERGLLTVVRLEDEWFDDVRDPAAVVDALKSTTGVRPDIFTFWQRVPETQPKYSYYTELEALAVLPITSFDHWWTKQAKGTTRNMVRKSQKMGIEVRECSFDDDFISGMADIFNESPVRQGRQFWHYGKSFDTIKRQFSRYLFREDLIGAYYRNELVGFVMLGNAGRFGVLGQFISKFKHRDKAVNNALMAKTIQVCEKRQLPYLTYGGWDQTSLVDFKRHSGFEEMKIPRYFVPLSFKGKLALQLGLHRGVKQVIPSPILGTLKNARNNWYNLRKRLG